jgi:hypothetical protein
VTVLDTQAVPVDPDMARKIKREASKLEASRVERDRLIVQAVEAGGGVREVARLADLSHPSVLAIVRKARDGRA